MDVVGHPEPAPAPVALGVARVATRLQPDSFEVAQAALPGAGRRFARVCQGVPAVDLERAGGRAYELQGGGERREVVPLDTTRQIQQLLRDGWNAQHVAQRQHPSLVDRALAELEDHPDDGLRAERHRGDGAGQRDGRELRRDLVVEGLGEGSGTDEREDGSVAHTAVSPAPRQAFRPAAVRSASALSVRSHVKSWSLRPKWP